MDNEFRTGEELAIKCLKAKGYDVIDRRDNPLYWKMDIDLTALYGKEKIEIEIKWDKRISVTGSFFFELVTDMRQRKVGWATYTQSDYIFYGDSQSGIFYVFKTSDMREYLQAHDAEYETRTATDYNRDGSIRKQSLGAIVPIEQFSKAVSVQEIDIAQRLQGNGF